MPRVLLTDRFAAAAKALDDARTDYFDQIVSGLGLRVTPNGHRSWSFCFTSPSDGKWKRLTLGSYPATSLAAARGKALEAKSHIEAGQDPRTMADPATINMTVRELVEHYLADPEKAVLRSRASIERRLRRNVLPIVGDVKISDLRRRDIRNVTEPLLRRNVPGEAILVFTDIRAAVRWAVQHEYLEHNPLEGMKKPAVIAARNRVLVESEIHALWNSLPVALAKSTQCQRIIKLCLITAQRVGEISGMRRAELDLAAREADGTLLYQVLRLEPKDFRQRRPDGNGKWIWKLEDRRVLYRLPELLKFPDASVFVCEGEKDADRIAQLGCCATTVAAGKWTAECVAGLAGRDVVILEDNDEAGRTKALAAAQALNGPAKTIRIVSLPDLPDKGDVSDWLDANRANANKFFDACFAVPEWNPTTTPLTSPPAASPAPPEKQTAIVPLPFINIATWKDQTVPERQWTVKDRIPASNVTLLSGEGSVGKSILSLHLATAVVLGRDWLGTLPEMGAALVICCEDDEGELWRRLDLIFQHYGAACTEFKKLHLLSLAGQETILAAPNNNGLIQPTQLFGRIHRAACDIQPKLIVLDNSADIYGGSENDRTQVRCLFRRVNYRI